MHAGDESDSRRGGSGRSQRQSTLCRPAPEGSDLLYSFFWPKSILDSLRLFENETFLSYSERTIVNQVPTVSSAAAAAMAFAAMGSGYGLGSALGGSGVMSDAVVRALAAVTPDSVLGQAPFVRPRSAALDKSGLRPMAALRRLQASNAAEAAAAAAAAGTGTAGARGDGKAQPAKRVTRAQSAAAAAAAPAAAPSQPSGADVLARRRSQRVAVEIKRFIANPIDGIAVFPSEDDLFVWRIVLRAPDNCPYTGAVYELVAEFPDQYPSSSPQIRFVDPIIHCNINSAGKVCHSIFDRNYNPSLSMQDLLFNVQMLMAEPEAAEPLDSMLGEQLRTDKAGYEAKAAAAAEPFKKISYHDKCKAVSASAEGVIMSGGSIVGCLDTGSGAGSSSSSSSAAAGSGSGAIVLDGAADEPASAAGRRKSTGAASGGKGKKRGRASVAAEEDDAAAAAGAAASASASSSSSSAAASASNSGAALLDRITCKETGDIFINPVITPSGYVFERSWLEEYLLKKEACDPISKTPLKIDQCKADADLRSEAEAYRKVMAGEQ